MQVSVGDFNCRVTASNDTAITCDVGPGVPGVAAITVDVHPSGLAVRNVSLARRFQVESVDPQTGSTAGMESSRGTDTSPNSFVLLAASKGQNSTPMVNLLASLAMG